MPRHVLIAREIDNLKQQLLFLGGKVEENYNRAVRALETRNADLARKAIAADDEVDRLEVRLEEECLKVLALHQPVAGDLRFIITVLKVNNELERIDDLSETLAEHAVFLSEKSPCPFPFDFVSMSAMTRAMLKESLDALVGLDLDKALRVKASDDAVDDLNRAMYQQVQKEIQERPDLVEIHLHFIGISRCLERIADLSTSIAEDVVYLVSGAIARH
jgi:phosphate transport system protein